MDMVDRMFGKRGEGAGKDIAGSVVTDIYAPSDTGFTIVSLDTKQRYLIMHTSIYKMIKPYYDQDERLGYEHLPVWIDEDLAQRLKEKRHFNE